MLVGPDGAAVGSVSGGCVEASVYEVATEVRDGGAAQLVRYGVSDDDALSVGLTCGGTIEIFVERVDAAAFAELGQVADSIATGVPVATATVVAGPGVGRRMVVWPDRVAGSLGSDGLDEAVAADARGSLAAGRTGAAWYGEQGQRRGEQVRVFTASFVPPPRMLVFGAIDFAAATASIGQFLGYRVTVCDARPVFATAKRFPGVEVVVDWPHRYLAGEVAAGRVDRRTVVCVLTHDAKFDVPVLKEVLAHDVAYVGAMGSRRTHADRLARLRDEGVPAEQLARLASPIGLDLGARTPEETAVSIAAEVIARQWGGSGRPLSELEGSIHRHRM